VALATPVVSQSQPVDLEATMVQRAQGGDARAFRWLFDRHAPAIHRFLRDMLRSSDAADEATQETFVRAYHALREVRAVERFRPWLFGTARRVSLEQHRRNRRASGPLDDDRHPPDRSPDPESALIGRESDAVLASALDKLPEERRSALVLRLDHGLDYDAIGEAMGWPLSKVKNELHRARLELRAHLSTYGDA